MNRELMLKISTKTTIVVRQQNLTVQYSVLSALSVVSDPDAAGIKSKPAIRQAQADCLQTVSEQLEPFLAVDLYKLGV